MALISTDKEKVKRVIPKGSQKVIDAAVARLYIAYPNTSEWTYTGLSGAVILVDDLVGHTFFLKLVDIQGHRGVVWDQELYLDFQYNQDRSFFHTFELEDCLGGLLFDDTSDASHFFKRVTTREKHGSKKTVQNRNAIALQKKPEAPKAPGPRGEFTSTGEQRIRRTTHVQYYDDKPPPEWRSLYAELESAGITEDMIADNKEFIKDYINKQGGPLVGLEPPVPRKYQHKQKSQPAEAPSVSHSYSVKKKAPPPPPTAGGPVGTPSPGVESPATRSRSASVLSSHQNSEPESSANQSPAGGGTPEPSNHVVHKLPPPLATPQQFQTPPPPQQTQTQPQQYNYNSSVPQQPPSLPPQSGRPAPPLPGGNRPTPPLPTGNRPTPPLPTGNRPSPPQAPPRAGAASSMPPAPPQRFGQPSAVPTQQGRAPPPAPPPRRGNAPPPAPPPRSTGGAPPPAPPPRRQAAIPQPPAQQQYQQPPPQQQQYSTPQAPAFPAQQAPQGSSAPAPPPLPPSQQQSSAPAPPPLPPQQTSGNAPAPPPLPTQQQSSAPAPPPLPQGNEGPTAPLPQVDSGRDALLASIRGAGVGSLRKTDKSQLDKPSVILQEQKGEAPPPSSGGAPGGGGGSLADALAAALSNRKNKVSKSDDESDGEEW